MSLVTLPVEMLIKIFEYLPDEDLPLLIRTAVAFQEVITKYNIKGTLNLEKSYLLEAKDVRLFFRKDRLAPNIKNLRLNGVWWFESPKLIQKCPNLKSLKILDIRLTTKQFLDILSSCPKIEDIEFSWPVDLTVINIHDLRPCENVLKNIKHIKFFTSVWRPYLRFLKYLTSLCTLFVIYDSLSVRNYVVPHRSFNQGNEEHEDPNSYTFPELREIKILCRTASFESFLNRVHFKLVSNMYYSSFASTLLGPYPNLNCLCSQSENDSPVTELVANMPKLESLHYFASCPIPLELPTYNPKKPFKQMFVFKRPRIGESKSSEKAGNAAFNKVIDNCPNLKVLEIAAFKNTVGENICQVVGIHWQCLENIRKLSLLTHLTLESLPITSGAFFETVARNCDKIEYLRVKDLGLSAKCLYLKELSLALPIFKNLTSFRFENNYILPAVELFEALNNCRNLERFAVFSKKEVYLLREEPISTLLLKRNLLFAYIDIFGVTRENVKRINKKVKPNKSEFLFYHIVNDGTSLRGREIPLKHSRELVQYMPWVAI
ncbi:F-box/LRR-repeat protein 18 [Armadillidium nasatum]|uniref:F-box/LRR-repeat protein 18 n=1 Tax=Armadillidium nasatum TaxID=96803 RepID=A0A5N5TP22_9CRUS|nr:F-box/LRR-repeat protein 18 [Armadillidium nasatum]